MTKLELLEWQKESVKQAYEQIIEELCPLDREDDRKRIIVTAVLVVVAYVAVLVWLGLALTQP